MGLLCPLCLATVLERVMIYVGDKRMWICEDCRQHLIKLRKKMS